MRSPRRLVLVLVVVVVAAFSAACHRSAAVTLRVLGAQSLERAFRQAATSFEGAHPGVTVETSFAGSQILAAQIEHGAPADVIATADERTMDALAGKHLVDAPEVFAENRLVVVVPAGGSPPFGGPVASAADLARPGLKVVLAGDRVPAGHYAREALARLGILDAVSKNVVSNEQSVAGVLAKVELGEADAGMAYATDVAASDGKARAIDLPESARVDVAYPIAVASASAHKDLARAFVGFVRGGPGRSALTGAGFSAP